MEQTIFEELDYLSRGNQTIKSILEAEIEEILEQNRGKSREEILKALQIYLDDMHAYFEAEQDE